MRVSTPVLALAASLALPGAAHALESLDWGTTNCPDSSYNFCATVEFCAGGGGVYGFRLPGETFCAISTAPVIRLVPGSKYALTLHNTATGTEANLHTHGLHVSGDGNSDDITRHTPAGECLTYTYDIASDHMGGTYWYHAHLHGSVNEHVSGGAFGMLIVEEQASVTANADVRAWMDNEVLLVASVVGSTRLGNGLSNLELPLTADEWHRLRVVGVDPRATPNDLVVGSGGCEVRVVAYDGVWRNEVPHSVDTNRYSLTGASRMDFAVRCSAGSHDVLLGGKNSRSGVATLVATAGDVTSATPFDGGNNAWQPARPRYLQDLRSAAVDNTFAISMSASSINGQSWDSATPLDSFDYDTVQEWTISAAGAHPYHLHVYHMQVVSPGGCGHHEEGEWYDVISDNSCTVRFRTADLGGRVIMHCHVLSHEDNGAMTWVDVQGGPAPDTAFIAASTCNGGNGCVNDGTCTLVFPCGSTDGLDSCSDACTAGSAGTCSGGQVCDSQTFECVPNCSPDGSCAAIDECGSTDGLDSCGGACTATAGECGAGEACDAQNQCAPAACVPDGSCTAVDECGSTAGVDSCGGACTATAGECGGAQVCDAANNLCEDPLPECAGASESCSNTDCCVGLSCSSGKRSSRVCS